MKVREITRKRYKIEVRARFPARVKVRVRDCQPQKILANRRPYSAAILVVFIVACDPCVVTCVGFDVF